MANRLAGESSLYLRQHANNPVDWFPWGHEAIAKAKAEQKPIFLSVGYSACHWCHVMEHESFEDEATAAVMNEHFICIKVDREERPDLDQIYMTSLQMLTREGGGWPLSVWLTPELTPFYAGTYFPPRDMYGRPSFRRVLMAVANAWARQREQLESLGTQVAETLQSTLTHLRTDAKLTDEPLHKALQALKQNYDAVHGGFGGAPKFPHPVDLRLLLRLSLRFQDQVSTNMVAHSLTMMARGGICDQIGGGFHRYSVDAQWLVPHFEKMLYDNALLASACHEAFLVTAQPDLQHVAHDTLRYVQREMLSPTDAFYSTQDADSEGEEGKFYLWSDAEIDTLLGPDADFARRVWGITPHGNFEGHTILTRKRSDEEDARLLGLNMSEFQAKLHSVRETLYQHRARRVWPGRDEKILTAWNGLMIAAFAHAGTDEHAAIARRVMQSILATMRTPDGRLLRTRSDDQPAKIAAFLEDYAYIIDALIALYEYDFDPQWIARACELADIMIRDYCDAEEGGFFYTLTNQNDLIARTKDWHDGSTPSGNAVAATVLLKLAILCDRPDYRTAAEKTLLAFDGLVHENPAAAAQMLIARDFYLGPVHEISVIGPRHNAVIRFLRTSFLPRCVITFHDPADGEPPTIIAPLRGKTAINSQTTTYICRDYQCEAPHLGDAAVEALRKLPS